MSKNVNVPYGVLSRTVILEDVEVMSSLAEPKKIAVQGSDGKTYQFLGKPKDDLRKDARLMDLYAIINKFLKSDSECRRRQLRKVATAS